MSSPRRVLVRYDAGDRLAIDVGGHRLIVDQPVADGGGDAGPTPTELFVASLVSCMGFFAQRFLRRNGVDPETLLLDAVTTTAARPNRVAGIDISISVPDLDASLVEPLRRVIEHCTVHNTITSPPDLRIRLDVSPTDRAAVRGT